MDRGKNEPNGKTGTISIVAYELAKNARFSLVYGGRKRALSRILNFCNFWKNQKADELLIMIFENSLPRGIFGEIK